LQNEGTESEDKTKDEMIGRHNAPYSWHRSTNYIQTDRQTQNTPRDTDINIYIQHLSSLKRQLQKTQETC